MGLSTEEGKLENDKHNGIDDRSVVNLVSMIFERTYKSAEALLTVLPSEALRALFTGQSEKATGQFTVVEQGEHREVDFTATVLPGNKENETLLNIVCKKPHHIEPVCICAVEDLQSDKPVHELNSDEKNDLLAGHDFVAMTAVDYDQKSFTFTVRWDRQREAWKNPNTSILLEYTPVEPENDRHRLASSVSISFAKRCAAEVAMSVLSLWPELRKDKTVENALSVECLPVSRCPYSIKIRRDELNPRHAEATVRFPGLQRVVVKMKDTGEYALGGGHHREEWQPIGARISGLASTHPDEKEIISKELTAEDLDLIFEKYPWLEAGRALKNETDCEGFL